MNRRIPALLAFFLLLAAAVILGLGLPTARHDRPPRTVTSLPTGPAQNRRLPPPLPDDNTAGDPFPGRITCLYSDGRALYAGNWHTGVYRLSASDVWQPFKEGLTGYRDIMTIAGRDDELYLGTFQGELWASDGRKWRLLTDFGEGEAAIIRAIYPQDGRLLVAAGDGIYEWAAGMAAPAIRYRGKQVTAVARLGGGTDWLIAELGNGLSRCSKDFLACEKVAIYPGGKIIAGLAAFHDAVYIAAEGDGVYRTRDGRDFFSLPLEADIPNVLFADASSLAIAFEDDGLLIAADEAIESWRNVKFPRAITALAAFRGAVYFGTDGVGVFRVTPDGYEAVNQGLLAMDEKTVEEILRVEVENPR